MSKFYGYGGGPEIQWLRRSLTAALFAPAQNKSPPHAPQAPKVGRKQIANNCGHQLWKEGGDFFCLRGCSIKRLISDELRASCLTLRALSVLSAARFGNRKRRTSCTLRRGFWSGETRAQALPTTARPLKAVEGAQGRRRLSDCLTLALALAGPPGSLSPAQLGCSW